jgi:hypothetical protein
MPLARPIWSARAVLLVATIFAAAIAASPVALYAAPQATPPTIDDIADITIGINGSTGPVAFTVGDAETPAASLVLTGSSSNQGVVPDANIVFGGSGASRTVTVTPAADVAGSATITVTVTDGDAQTANDTFLVTVIVPALLIDLTFGSEGDTGTTDMLFSVTLNDAVPIQHGVVTVDFGTSRTPPGAGLCGTILCATAIGGVDYTPTSGTLTFTASEVSKTIAVPVIGDRVPEIDEIFFVNLSNPVNASISGLDGMGPGFIFDDDNTKERRAEFEAWWKPVGVDTSSRPGSLMKTELALGWNAGAGSTNALLTGDGSMEFTAIETDTIRIIGLSNGNASTNFNEIDFGIELYTGARVLVNENGIVRGNFASYAEGDRFTVGVENGSVVYRKNGAAFYTSTVAPVYPLLVDTALFTDGATLWDVVLSGRLARDVEWGNLAGMNDLPQTSNGFPYSSLVKFDVDGWLNGGAASTRALLTGDGFAEFTATETDTTRVFGLSRDNTSTDWTDIDFGIYLYSNGATLIVEGGVLKGSFGPYETGDRFQIAVESNQVKYRRNGVTMYTSLTAPTFPLMIDTAFFSQFATLENATIGGALATDVTFAGVINAFVCDCGLVKPFSGDPGWDAGAVSTQMLLNGDGFVEFADDGFGGQRIAGLSHGNTNTDFTDVDFGILLADNDSFHVYEAGVYKGYFGVSEEGDRFRVAIENGVVKYRRNGVLFYTSLNVPTYPLLMDMAIFTPDAGIADAVFAGNLGQAVEWTAKVNVAASDSLLTKTGAIGWNAGAISTRSIITDDGFVSFTTNETDTQKILGLSHGNSNSSFTDVDFGILLTDNGRIHVYENGTDQGSFGDYMLGDTFHVSIENGAVQYRKNGALFYTSAAAPTYPLLVDAALFTPDATLTDVVIAGNVGDAVAWTAAAGVSASGNSLTKTVAAGWNAGAVSSRAIPSGDGFVSFTTKEVTTQKIVGLSNGNTNNSFMDVDYGILLTSNARIYVYENGTSRGTFGPNAAGDLFQVTVEGLVVRYLRNGAVFYTSGAPAPTYPLLVDTALFTPGATIRDVVLACSSAPCQ